MFPFSAVPPTFTAGTGRLIRGVRPGGSITLSCAVEGDPTPDVTYTHPDPDPHNATFDSNVITIASAASDQGVVMYTCTANNSIASDVRLTYDLYTGGKHLFSICISASLEFSLSKVFCKNVRTKL